MRFPFFATNREFDEERARATDESMDIWYDIQKARQEIVDLEQKFLELEGRVNTLEVNKRHGRKKGK